MLDPSNIPAFLQEISQAIPSDKRANIKALTKAQRNALVTLLGGPAERIGSFGWLNSAGPRFSIEHATIRSLVADRLVVVSEGDALARLTIRGRWYAMTAAGDEADRLRAAMLKNNRRGY